MLARGQRAHEGLEHEAEPILGFRRPDLGDRRLLADESFELGDEGGDDAAAQAERGLQPQAPTRHFRFRRAEERHHERSKCLDERRVRGLAAQQIDLARHEPSFPLGNLRAKLLDERRFADAGLPLHQHELVRARRNAVESSLELLDLALPSVELLRQRQLSGEVDDSELESRDGAGGLESPRGFIQIGEQRFRRLVAVLGHLGQ